MPWPDHTDIFGDHIMDTLGEILILAAVDTTLSGMDKVRIGRLVGQTLLRSYATSQSDSTHATRVGDAWVNAVLGQWDFCASELNHADMLADDNVSPGP